MTSTTANLLYSEEHEWVLQLDENRVRIGISDYAQKQLGDIVFVENPAVDDEITANESMGTIESVKAVSELYAPVSGSVVRVNEELNDTPETINENPYKAGWLIEVEISNPEELESLLNQGEYEAFISEGEE
ncbi:glycine cleavage system protein GcvH [Priestia aryabhattai]|uniref:glycine cleavage system protein GcvH n=1 Tax=Priestia aryabhattai TaxID=412384 RepID=UPI001ED0C180|nr:glycine cleavage system protein GcvH [Priestia aryabhattai]MBY0095090.1 glycine cleavage system protein GcvH [Priestia aryabhattai]MBY0105466.1 glycine cleavage system protein GcvH [Priestia aryabhattai]